MQAKAKHTRKRVTLIPHGLTGCKLGRESPDKVGNAVITFPFMLSEHRRENDSLHQSNDFFKVIFEAIGAARIWCGALKTLPEHPLYFYPVLFHGRSMELLRVAVARDKILWSKVANIEDLREPRGLAEACVWMLFASNQVYSQWARLSSDMEQRVLTARIKLLFVLAPAPTTGRPTGPHLTVEDDDGNDDDDDGDNRDDSSGEETDSEYTSKKRPVPKQVRKVFLCAVNLYEHEVTVTQAPANRLNTMANGKVTAALKG